MGEIRRQRPVLLMAAVTSRYLAAIEWARCEMTAAWGDIALQSSLFAFRETDFYLESMGDQLQKQLFAFSRLVDPGEIARTKLLANDWESQYKAQSGDPELRPVNIDPGYLTEAKLVLLTTKDRDHRIYLSDGIFAEVTLHFQDSVWRAARWTYPDYQRADYHEFFTQCRDWLRKFYRDSTC